MEMSLYQPQGTLRQFGMLTRWFLMAAFMNFIAGVVLGGILASQPNWWGVLGPIHGEINPFGWLTMLIYGMTYAVLSLSAGIRPPFSIIGVLHWLTAEAGVATIVIACIFHVQALLACGYTLQAIAPMLFLANILTAVRAKRNEADLNQMADESPNSLAFLWKNDAYRPADRVGQRGTDVALIVFLVAAWWTAVDVYAGAIHTDSSPLSLPYLLNNYGWILGTVLAVAAHLMPRLLHRPTSAKVVLIGQWLWGASVVLLICGCFEPMLGNISRILFGATIVWHGVLYLQHILGAIRKRTAPEISIASWIAFVGGFVFAVVLGVYLLTSGNPASLIALHLLFLGFITTLVYGIGYRLFPEILGVRPRLSILMVLQVIAHIAGTSIMLIGLDSGWATWLEIGGILAAVAALIFILQWVFTKNL